MRTLTGIVGSRYGVASQNLAAVEELILKRTGLPSMARGTLNVTAPEEYIVTADAIIEPHEYRTGERLKLQRCRVRGVRMWIMRPDTHEPGEPARVLELVSHLKLQDVFRLTDGDSLQLEVEGTDEWWQMPVWPADAASCAWSKRAL